MWAFTPTSVYLVDSKPGYSATAVGVNSCVRCVVAAITTIFSADAVDGLGTGILFSILAGVTFLNAGFVIICYLRGYKWRLKFEEKYMPELYEISMADAAIGNHDEEDRIQDEKMEYDQSNKQQVLDINKSSNDEDNNRIERTQTQRSVAIDRIERITTQHSAVYSIA
jgi:hypothetical protein